MKMLLDKKGWIERCEITETYAFMEALEEFEDFGGKWSSDDIAEYLMDYMGGMRSVYHLVEMINLCYDITSVDFYTE